MSQKPIQLPLPGFDAARGQWRQDYADGRSGGGDTVCNRSGIELKPLYTPEDRDGEAYMDDLGFPGQAPFTRGVYPTMHPGPPLEPTSAHRLRHARGLQRSTEGGAGQRRHGD